MSSLQKTAVTICIGEELSQSVSSWL